MNLIELKEHCEQLGMKARRFDGEYQVTFADCAWSAPATYYTNDIDDAAATAVQMAEFSIESTRAFA